jgi:hypothetical protein
LPSTLLRLPRKAQANADPWTRLRFDTDEEAIEPPALCRVEPKTAKKTAGAMMALVAKNHWILWLFAR